MKTKPQSKKRKKEKCIPQGMYGRWCITHQSYDCGTGVYFSCDCHCHIEPKDHKGIGCCKKVNVPIFTRDSNMGWEKEFKKLVGTYTLDGVEVASIHNVGPMIKFIQNLLKKLSF